MVEVSHCPLTPHPCLGTPPVPSPFNLMCLKQLSMKEKKNIFASINKLSEDYGWKNVRCNAFLVPSQDEKVAAASPGSSCSLLSLSLTTS